MNTKIMDPHDLAFTISPSVSNIVLHSEESGPSWVEFIAWYQQDNKYEIVRITLQRSVGVRMCSVGGEAGTSGIGEVSNSLWLQQLNEHQHKYYPDYADNFKNVRHYYIVGHDESIEFLSEGFTWKTMKVLHNW